MQEVARRFKLSLQKDIAIKLEEFNTLYNPGNPNQ
jgi:hypothetical protein